MRLEKQERRSVRGSVLFDVMEPRLLLSINLPGQELLDSMNYQLGGEVISLDADTTPPSTPGTPDLVSASDSGYSNTDNLTNDRTPTFTWSASTDSETGIANYEYMLGTAGSWISTWSSAASVTLPTLGDGSYTLYIRAKDKAGNVSEPSPGISFVIDGRPPAIPTLNSPSKGSTVFTDHPVVTWNESDPNEIWRYELTYSQNGYGRYINCYSSTGYQFDPGSLSWNVICTWGVEAVDKAGNGSWYSSWTFTPQDPTPGTPDLDSGSDSGLSNTDNITKDSTPTFTWAPSSGSGTWLAGYEYKLGSSGAWTSTGNGTASSVTLPGLADGVYWIYVRAKDGSSPANYSDSTAGLSFTIDTTAPKVPTVKYPGPNSPAISGYASFSWGAVTDTDVSSYHLNVIEDWDSRRTAVDKDVTGTSYTLSESEKLQLEANYVWRVSATDVAGNTSSYSSDTSFTVHDKTLPSCPWPHLDEADDTGESNSDRITNDNTPTITWTPSIDLDTGLGGYRYVLIPRNSVWTDADWIYIDPSTSVTSPSLADGSYYFEMQAFDLALPCNYSDVVGTLFMIDTTAPGRTSVTAPGSFVMTLQPTLFWDAPLASADIWKYHLEVIENWGAHTKIVDKDITPDADVMSGSYTLDSSESLQWDKNYIWHVYAADVAGNVGSYGDQSLSPHDTTPPTTPGAADLDSASDSGKYDNDNITNDRTPTFTWAASDDSFPGLAGYEYKINSGAWTSTGNGTAATVTLTTLADGVYTIYIRAKDGASPANYSVAGPGLTFTIDTIAPLRPSLNSPGNGSWVPTIQPTVAWGAPNGAGDIWNYHLLVTENWGGYASIVDKDLSGTSYALGSSETLQWSKNYAWRVYATDVAGNSGAYSNQWSFTPGSSQVLSVRFEDSSGNELADGAIRNAGDKVWIDVCTQGMRGANATIYLFEDDASGDSNDLLGPIRVAIPSNSDSSRIEWTVPWNIDTDGTDVFPEYRVARSTDPLDTVHTLLLNVRESGLPTAPGMPDLADDSDTAPAGVTSGPLKNDNITSDFTPKFSWGAATDSLSGIDYYEWRLDGGAWTRVDAAAVDLPAVTGQGDHAFSVRARDKAGNIGPQSSVHWTLDTVAPTVPLAVSPVDDTLHDTSPILNWRDSLESTGIWQYSVSLSDHGLRNGIPEVYTAETAGSFWSAPRLKDGDWWWQVQASDIAGNVSEGASEMHFAIAWTVPGLSIATDEDTKFNGTVAAGDSETGFTYALFNGPSHGSVTMQPDGSFSYVPDVNYNGPDSFTFQANDGAEDSSPAAVSITVKPVNDAPTLGNVSSLTGAVKDTDFTISYEVLKAAADESDVESGPIAFRIESVKSGTLTYGGLGVVAGSTLVWPGEALVWHPAASVSGLVSAFTVRAWDGQAASGSSVLVKVNVDSAPTVNALSKYTDSDTPLNATVTGQDPENNALTYALVGGPTHGTVLLRPDGTFRYVPSEGFIGNDSFTFRADDGSAVSAAAAVSITVGRIVSMDRQHPVTYMDANQTPVVISLSGDGTALVMFAHGAPCNVSGIVLGGTSERTVLSIKTTGSGRGTLVGSIDAQAGSLGGISAATTDVTGSVVVGASQSAKASVSLVFDQLLGAVIDSAMPVKSLTASEWMDGGKSAAFQAPWVGTMTIKGKRANAAMGTPAVAGDLEADILITGAQEASRTGLKTLKVAGAIRGDVELSDPLVIAKSISAACWTSGQLTGSVLGTISVKGDMGASVTAGANIAAVTVGGNLTGTWHAMSIGRMAINGNVQNAAVITTQVPSDQKAIGSFTVKGWLDHSRLDVQGNVGSLTVGGARNSSVYSGAMIERDVAGRDIDGDGQADSDGVIDMPVLGDEFNGQYQIGKLTVTGKVKDSGYSWINTNLSAPALGSVKICFAKLANNGIPFGITTSHVGSIKYSDADKARNWTKKNLTAPQAFDYTDLVLQVV